MKTLSSHEGGGDRKINAAYLVGRRFEWRPVSASQDGAQRRLPDVTFVAADPDRNTITAHLYGGGRQVLNLTDVIDGVYAGSLVESELGVPFVNDDERRAR